MEGKALQLLPQAIISFLQTFFSTFTLVQALSCKGLAVFLELLNQVFLPFKKTLEMRQQTQ